MGIVARQATWNTLLTVAGMVLGFVNMALLFPKHLSPDEFGLTRLLVSIAVIAAQVAQFGGESTIIRYFPYFKDRSRGHRGLFGLAVLVGSVGALLAMLILGLFHHGFAAWFSDRSGLYATYGMVVLPLVAAEVYFIVLRGMGRTAHRSIASVFAREFMLRVLQTALIFAHIRWQLAFGTFLALYVLTFVITTLVLVVDLVVAGELKLGFGHMRIPRRMGRSMLRYALFTFGSGLAGIAVGNIDQVMVGAMLHEGLAYVAYYAVAVFLASLIMVPGRALLLPMVPLIAEAWRKRDHRRIAMIYHRTASIQLVASAFVFLCLWASLDPLFSFLRPEYAIGKPVFVLVGLTNVLVLSTGLSASIVSTSRSYWFDAASGMVLLLLNVALDYVFILAWGFVGAAWSSLVSALIVMAWRLWYLKRRFDLWPYDGMTVRAIALIVFSAVLVWKMPHFGTPMVDILWRCCLLALVFWPAVYWLRIAPEVGEQVSKILGRLSKGVR